MDSKPAATHMKKAPKSALSQWLEVAVYRSGRRDSNPRPQPWQGCERIYSINEISILVFLADFVLTLCDRILPKSRVQSLSCQCQLTPSCHGFDARLGAEWTGRITGRNSGWPRSKAADLRRSG